MSVVKGLAWKRVKAIITFDFLQLYYLYKIFSNNNNICVTFGIDASVQDIISWCMVFLYISNTNSFVILQKAQISFCIKHEHLDGLCRIPVAMQSECQSYRPWVAIVYKSIRILSIPISFGGDWIGFKFDFWIESRGRTASYHNLRFSG